ncbi:calpain-9 [Plakobranchus ocellatus]|uniref:Calpain-9 n=1 Tax=Plakobranchus ocellatus TaxID=259542 RepID=A0AAV4D9R8_9GAST|nr:calpain-9 [Plakobranchus ocellatus]
MWFLRRMLRIPWTAKKTNERVLNEANKRRSLVRTIRKRQATFLGHVMRRGKLEHLATQILHLSHSKAHNNVHAKDISMGCGSSTQSNNKDGYGSTRATVNLNNNDDDGREYKSDNSSLKSDLKQDTNDWESPKEEGANLNTNQDENEYYGFDGSVSNQPKSPPPYEPTPPPHESTLPPHESTPPAHEPTPPPHEPTPHPREPTPPPHEPTPQPRESTPPPNEPLPSPNEPVTQPEPLHSEEDDDDDTPFDDDGIRDKEGYTQNSMGLFDKTTDFRSDYAKDDAEGRPKGDPDNLYIDHEFPLGIAIVQDNDGIEWKRPKDFLEDPVLFTDGTTRFDIGQGSAGTCWFLSTVANIADNEAMLKQVIPDGSYKIEDSDAYDGVFHARFYRFGKWEDVYIDDFLPVIYGNVLWGAKSATEERELWVALLEKAFARLYGSYDAIYGGQPGDAYLLLTGGIGERIELEDHDEKPNLLYNRIRNALSAGCQVSCVVPDEYDEVYGLVGGHAYSLVGVQQIGANKLVRVRNPWGHGEWKGSWSDGSKEWASIEDAAVIAPNKDDGEFYVSLDDFMTYFSQTTICSLTPDFDCDGSSDSLNYISNVYGEWSGSFAAGFHKLLQNPRFCFTITQEGLIENSYAPFVVQLIQQSEKRKTDNISIRCDIFRVLGDKINGQNRCIALEIQGKKNNVYAPELQSSFRHKLSPGSYVVVPSTVKEGQEKAFLLRMFTSAPLQNIRQISQDVDIVSCEFEDSIEISGKVKKLTFERTLFGQFMSGKNAGGQVSHRDSYHLNPQYQITIPDNGKGAPLVIHIMQTYKEPQYPVGFRLYKMEQGVQLPVDIGYLYDHYQDCPADLTGSQSKFMISWDVDIRYWLPPGRYIGLVHLDEPDTEKSFAIVFKSTTPLKIKGFQTG